MILGTIDPELLRTVDDRFHAKDQAELVVHLQPVGLHAVLDPRAEPALVLVVGVDLAVEAAIPLAAEKAQDVLGSEGAHGVVEYRAIQAGQGRATGEQQVGGVLGLIDDPVHGVTGSSSRSKGLTCLAHRSRIFGQLSLAKRSAMRCALAGSSSWVNALCCCTKPSFW